MGHKLRNDLVSFSHRGEAIDEHCHVNKKPLDASSYLAGVSPVTTEAASRTLRCDHQTTDEDTDTRQATLTWYTERLFSDEIEL